MGLTKKPAGVWLCVSINIHESCMQIHMWACPDPRGDPIADKPCGAWILETSASYTFMCTHITWGSC